MQTERVQKSGYCKQSESEMVECNSRFDVKNDPYPPNEPVLKFRMKSCMMVKGRSALTIHFSRNILVSSKK